MVADNYEDLVKCGYMEMKLPRKHRKLGRQVWKRKWFILRRKSLQGLPRLEYHKSEQSCLQGQNKTVVELKTLIKLEEHCKSKTRKPTAFRLVFADTYIFLATQTEANVKEWLRLIQKLVWPELKIIPSPNTPEGSFLVTVICTDDSERLNLVGDYILSVTTERIVLYRIGDYENAVIQWHLDDIPRFRLQKLNQLNDAEKIFIINLARTSHVTEGEFQFLTKDGRHILETVKSHTKQRRRLPEDSPRSTPVGMMSNSSSSVINISRSRSSSSSQLSNQSQVSSKHSNQSELTSKNSTASNISQIFSQSDLNS